MDQWLDLQNTVNDAGNLALTALGTPIKIVFLTVFSV